MTNSNDKTTNEVDSEMQRIPTGESTPTHLCHNIHGKNVVELSNDNHDRSDSMEFDAWQDQDDIPLSQPHQVNQETSRAVK